MPGAETEAANFLLLPAGASHAVRIFDDAPHCASWCAAARFAGITRR
jgi:hypothetical protein